MLTPQQYLQEKKTYIQHATSYNHDIITQKSSSLKIQFQSISALSRKCKIKHTKF